MIEDVAEVADSGIEGMHAASEFDRILDQSALVVLPIKLHLFLLLFDLVLVLDVVVVLDGEDAGVDAEHSILILGSPAQGVALRS